MMYDAVTIISAVPVLRDRIFSQDEKHEHHCTNGRTHLVYGQSESLSGIGDSSKLRSLLHDASLAGLSISPEPYPIVIFTDPGQDLDDELALILLASLVERRYVRPLAIVANLHPSRERARLAKGTLNELGLGHVPVGVGSDGGCTAHKDSFSETAFAYLGDEGDIEPDAEAMLCRVLMDEEPKSVLFLCISSLTDAASFLRNNEQLFVDKVHSVTIMGGVDLSTDEDHLGEGTGLSADSPTGRRRVLPPDTANNNTFDMPSSRFFYARLQEIGVKLNVLTRFAAYDCPLPRGIYDDMVKSGSPIALRLFGVQRTSIEELWKRCNAEGDERKGLPPRCSKAWYCKTFLGGRGDDRTGADSIWDLVKQFNMYDPMALILSVPPLAWIFFEHETPTGGLLRVVGATAEKSGVKRAAVLRGFMLDSLIEGVCNGRQPTAPFFVQPEPPTHVDVLHEVSSLRPPAEQRSVSFAPRGGE